MAESTAEWAKRLGISTDPTPPPVAGAVARCAYTPQDLARRALVLQSVAVVGSEVDPQPVVSWLKDQDLWSVATPQERAFLEDVSPSADLKNKFRWRQEAEWTLLWMIGMVEELRLPTQYCDTK